MAVRQNGSFPQQQVKSKKGKMVLYVPMDQSHVETKSQVHIEAEKTKVMDQPYNKPSNCKWRSGAKVGCIF